MAETLKVVLDQALDAATGQRALVLATEDIKQLLVEQMEASFAARQAPDGQEWLPYHRLDGRTQWEKGRGKGGMHRATIASILQGAVSAAGFVSDPSPMKAADAFHWRFQDKGARRKAKRTSRVMEPGTPFMAPPARPFYSVGDATVEQCAGVVADRLEEAMTQ